MAHGAQRHQIARCVISAFAPWHDMVDVQGVEGGGGGTAALASAPVAVEDFLPGSLPRRRVLEGVTARAADAWMERTGERPCTPTEASRHDVVLSCVWGQRTRVLPSWGAPLEESGVVDDANERPRVAGQDDNRAGAEDRVDGAALVAELAQVRPRKNRIRIDESLGGGHRSPSSNSFVSAAKESRLAEPVSACHT